MSTGAAGLSVRRCRLYSSRGSGAAFHCQAVPFQVKASISFPLPGISKRHTRNSTAPCLSWYIHTFDGAPNFGCFNAGIGGLSGLGVSRLSRAARAVA